jgi:hypothetical protein
MKRRPRARYWVLVALVVISIGVTVGIVTVATAPTATSIEICGQNIGQATLPPPELPGFAGSPRIPVRVIEVTHTRQYRVFVTTNLSYQFVLRFSRSCGGGAQLDIHSLRNLHLMALVPSSSPGQTIAVRVEQDHIGVGRAAVDWPAGETTWVVVKSHGLGG